jgi:type II secretory pathway pseudopilin PulG
MAELLVVLVILGAVAGLAQLSANPVRPAQLDAAVRDVAQALRFAQSDAIRTGAYRVVSCSVAANSIRIFALDMAPKPPIEDTANPVMNPINKKTYALSLSARPGSAAARIDSCQFAFNGAASGTQLTFGSDGAPVYVAGPGAPDVKPMTTGSITLSAGVNVRTITVDALTGRVTVSS